MPAQHAQGYGFSIHKPGVVAEECAPSTDSEGGNPDLKKEKEKQVHASFLHIHDMFKWERGHYWFQLGTIGLKKKTRTP